MQLLFGTALFVLMHVCVWWSTNAQFIEGWNKSDALFLSLLLAVPITLLAFFGSRYTYYALNEQAWAVRFVGFGISYLIFPTLTWYLLGESMFTWKTMTCVFLSAVIIVIQVWG